MGRVTNLLPMEHLLGYPRKDPLPVGIPEKVTYRHTGTGTRAARGGINLCMSGSGLDGYSMHWVPVCQGRYVHPPSTTTRYTHLVTSRDKGKVAIRHLLLV